MVLMPPGARVIHSVYTDKLALMEGGILWDFLTVIDVMHSLHFVTEHPTCTNEPIARQLTRILDELECWVSEEPEKFTGSDRKEFQNSWRSGISI